MLNILIPVLLAMGIVISDLLMKRSSRRKAALEMGVLSEGCKTQDRVLRQKYDESCSEVSNSFDELETTISDLKSAIDKPSRALHVNKKGGRS